LIKVIQAYTPKDWKRYSPHIIEPVLNLIPGRGKVLHHKALQKKDESSLMVKFQNGTEVHFNAMGNLDIPIYFDIFGSEENSKLVFSNTFDAFRSALSHFIECVFNRKEAFSDADLKEVVGLIELGG
jgi:hypothetical protein